MRSYWVFLLSIVATLGAGTLSRSSAAEPEVTPNDLPRIPATEPKDVLSTFQVRPGFALQLVAAEPLVVSPVAMDFDENGRLFVVEMLDYSERREEHLGRVRVLEDTDGDGRFDKSWIYIDQIPWPTAVLCYRGGVFIGTTPDILYCPDRNHDGVADSKEVVFTGFASSSLNHLNVQALLNSFRWGIDCRVHGSASVSGGMVISSKHPERAAVDLRGRDFSFDPVTLELRAESGGGQHGMSFDNTWRKFVCSNSDHIQAVLYEDRYVGLNPDAELPSVRQSIAVDGPAAEVFRISPDEPWRVIRTRWRVTGAVPGMIEGGGRASGYFTGATGVTIYRGNAFPAEYVGDAFVADCGSNLIHHKKLRPEGLGFRAERPADELDREFIASRDNWFRPVQFANAPDGTLYVIDMYRETIEHPWSLPESIKRHLDLNSGNNRGRIYRIVPEHFRQPRLPTLGAASTRELTHLMEHANGWHRDTASRLLSERQDRVAVRDLVRLARRSGYDIGRTHALWALNSLNSLEDGLLAEALADPSATVRAHAIRLAELRRRDGAVPPEIWQRMRPLAHDPDLRVRYQLAWTLGLLRSPEKTPTLLDLLNSTGSTPLIPAVLNSAGEEASSLFDLLLNDQQSPNSGDAPVLALARMLSVRHRAPEIASLGSALDRLGPKALGVEILSEVAAGLGRAGDSITRAEFASPLARHLPLAKQLASTNGPADTVSASTRAALQLLGHLPFDAHGDTLLDALKSDKPEWIQHASLEALASVQASELSSRVLSRWAEVSKPIRSDLVSLLLRRKPWIAPLLEALETGRMARADFSAEQIQRLRGYTDAALLERVDRIFGAARSGTRQEVVNQFLPALALSGKATAGRAVYDQRCATCHRVGGQGRAIGPDFESVRATGKEKLLTNILDPNREVSPSYLAYTVETVSGETVSGLLMTETADQVQLRGADGTEPRFARAQIKRLTASGISLMPEGLEQGLSAQSMADLLDFIAHGSPAVR